MLRVLAILDGSEEQLEEAVRRIVHKNHHLPAERSGRWVVKIFGSRTPKAHELDNVARTLAGECDVVLLARAMDQEWDHFRLLRGRDVIFDMPHPRVWLDCRGDSTDAWEFCLEEFGDPEDVQTVACIDPNDKLMKFLWDEEEAKLVENNVVENNEPGFVKQLLELANRKKIYLPDRVQETIRKANKVDAFFRNLFQWQQETIHAGLEVCQIDVDDNLLSQCFAIERWESTWVDSILGSFPAMLSSFGIPSLRDAIHVEDDGQNVEDFVDQLNVRKSFKVKDGQAETPPVWDSISDHTTIELLLKTTDKIKSIAFEEGLLVVPLTELGDLFMMAWSIDDEVDWLLEVKLPKTTFKLPDGSRFDWSRLHPRHKYDREIYRFKVGKRTFVNTFYAPRWFFPDPEGDAEFEAQAHRFNSGYPREARVSFYDFITALPNKTRLSLFTHSVSNPMPMTTTIFRGVVKDGQFEIASRYPKMTQQEIIANLDFLKKARGEKGWLKTAGPKFLKQATGTFWDPEPFHPKEIRKQGQLSVKLVPERGPSPYRRIATAVKKFSRDFGKLGFDYCGTIEAPKLGSVKVMCFAGPGDCTGHIVLEWATVRPEFWTRFQSGDILTTNTSDFLGMVTSHPKAGLYYRTYYDRPLSKVLKKHRDGIQRFVEHKNTDPITHPAEIEAFADNLIHFVKQHPEFGWLCGSSD